MSLKKIFFKIKVVFFGIKKLKIVSMYECGERERVVVFYDVWLIEDLERNLWLDILEVLFRKF